MVNITGKRMIEAGIYGISSENNLGVMMKGVNPLAFFPVDEGGVEISL